MEAPVRTNQIPRQIPQQSMYLKPIPSMLLVGILPFGAIFVELYFIMNSIWFHKVYYMFGFLFVCYGIMVRISSTLLFHQVLTLGKTDNYLLNGHYPLDLLPSLLGKLPLAMAILLHSWCLCNIYLPQCHLILDLKVELGRVHK